MGRGSWLFPDEIDRERMLDMERRLQRVRRAAFGVLALFLIAGGPWIGWWTLAPLALAGVLFKLAEDKMETVEHPEYWIFAAWAGSEVIIGASVALTGGAQVATMSWFAIPIVTLSARFSQRGVVAGVALTLGLMMAVAYGFSANEVVDDPTLLLAPVALVLATAILSTALMQSDMQHRSDALIDPLTGLLNRNALAGRVDELCQQSEVSGEPVGMIVADIDRFKRINDSSGHAVGDAVLKEIAYLLRKQLRAFELVYRLGGEEFLMLVPGADHKVTAELAERMRETVRAETFADGHRVSLSLGVSASPRGERFDYDAVFAQADAALYEAKRAGRDRVHTDQLQPAPAPAAG